MHRPSALLLGLCLTVGLLALCTGGCSSTPPNLELRIDAAMKIENPTMADQALSSIARDAANVDVDEVCHPAGGADEEYICHFAVKTIKQQALRDDTARYCALAYWHFGNLKAATDLAMLVHDPASRDELLKKFSGRETP